MQDRDALFELRHRLVAFFRRRVSNPALAEDLAQETLLRATRSRPDLRDEERLAPWLFTIARNLLTDAYRRQGVQKTEPVADLDDRPHEADLDDVEQAHRQLADCLRPLLGRLDDNHRQALEMCDLGTLSQKAAAEKLGLSPSGMKSRVQRARQRLLAALEACCHIERDARGNVVGFDPDDACC